MYRNISFGFYIIGILLLVALSCKDKKRSSLEKMVTEWIGKEIVFPEGLECLHLGKDMTCLDPNKNAYKILVYTDSVGCTSCKLNLHVWKTYQQEIDSIFQNESVEFLFYFQPKRRSELEYLLKREGFEHTVFLDEKGVLNDLNDFPEGMQYQCFLLDEGNRVISIGNPTLNQRIWDLYKQALISKNTT